MKKIKNSVIPIVIALISFTSFGQDEKSIKDKSDMKVQEMDSVYGFFLLINSGDTSKQIKLKDAGAYTIIYQEPVKDTITFNKIFYANGNIRELYPTSIDFDIRNETIEHNFKDGSVINTQNDYSSFYYSLHEKPRSINLKNIQYIDYSSPKRSIIHSIGLSTMILSAITIVAAPLINLDVQKTDTNNDGIKDKYVTSIYSNGYISTVKIGFIGLCVGFPISYFSRTKQYQITTNKSQGDNDFWYIGKQN